MTKNKASGPGRLGRPGALLLALAAALGAAPGPAAAEPSLGAWSPLAAWPLIAIHAALLPDGRVLTYGTSRDGQQTGRFVYDLWEPGDSLNGGHLTLPNTTATDLFCSAQLVLPGSGELLMTGGDTWNGAATTGVGNADATLFRPGSNSLATGPAMNRPRWYATMTTLPDGEIYVQGGRGGGDRPEVRGADGTFRLLPDVDTTRLTWWYPRAWVAPDGRLFGFADRSMYFVDPSGGGMLSGAGTLPAGPTGQVGVTSSEVMYAPGKILRAGGGSRSSGGRLDGSTGAWTIDIAGPVPRVAATSPLPAPLQWHTATVTPDGRVVVTGGANKNNQLVGVSDAAYLWDPATGAWTKGATTLSGRARLYHSTAILLPDASILVAGGGAPGPQSNTNAEIYYPPYLFDATGARAARPEIRQAPRTLRLGESFAMEVGDAAAVRRVTMIKTGAVTHSFNMDQRFLELGFAREGEAALRVTLPASPAAAPPGPYLLFALDERGVPSPGWIATLQVAENPAVAADHTPAVGETFDGAAFTLACPAGQGLAGVYGMATGATLARIGPKCVAVDAGGRWLGSPANGGRAGYATGGYFNQTCSRNTLVAAFRAQAPSAGALAQVELGCAAVGASGRVDATSRYLLPIGAGGGAPRGPFACGTGNPGYAIYGRASSTVRSFGLMCRSVAAPAV